MCRAVRRLGKALILRAPVLFTPLWAIISPWLKPRTASKVKFIDAASIGEHFAPEVAAAMLSGGGAAAAGVAATTAGAAAADPGN